MRWLGALVFALAAASSVLAASGLAVPPHRDPTGTPQLHDHLLTAYRYPLFLVRVGLVTVGLVSQRSIGPPEAGWALETPSQLQLDALVLATLAVIVLKLPRPTRRIVARLAAVELQTAQWRAGAAPGPPRGYLLRSA